MRTLFVSLNPAPRPPLSLCLCSMASALDGMQAELAVVALARDEALAQAQAAHAGCRADAERAEVQRAALEKRAVQLQADVERCGRFLNPCPSRSSWALDQSPCPPPPARLHVLSRSALTSSVPAPGFASLPSSLRPFRLYT